MLFIWHGTLQKKGHQRFNDVAVLKERDKKKKSWQVYSLGKSRLFLVEILVLLCKRASYKHFFTEFARGLIQPYFLALKISLAPKKVWSEVSFFLLVHSLQMALSAPEFICCLMMFVLHSSTLFVALFNSALLTQTTWSLQRWRAVCIGWIIVTMHDAQWNQALSLEESSCGWVHCNFWMKSFLIQNTPRDVRTLTAAAPSSPALASASVLSFSVSKAPHLRQHLGSLN